MNDRDKVHSKKIDRITGLPFNFIGQNAGNVQKEWVTMITLQSIERNKVTTAEGNVSADTQSTLRKHLGVGSYRTHEGVLRFQGDVIYKLKPLLFKMKLADNTLKIRRFC